MSLGWEGGISTPAGLPHWGPRLAPALSNIARSVAAMSALRGQVRTAALATGFEVASSAPRDRTAHYTSLGGQKLLAGKLLDE
jgi:hypothetical protein